MEPASNPGASAAERLARQIEDITLKRVAADQLPLPTMPAVAVKCIELLRQPDFSFKQVATILEKDPVLAARVLRLATSAAFGAGTAKLSLVEALARLGAKPVRTLLVEASAEKVFTSREPQIAAATRRVWQHSVAVAHLARDICAVVGIGDAEAGYLAGLLHDVGKPVVASILLEAERQIVELRNRSWIDSEMWQQVVAATHRQVGAALADKWDLPPVVRKCVRECAEFDAANRSSVVNAVCLANALAKTAGVALDGADVDDARALIMIGRSLLGLDDAVLKPLVSSIASKVESLYA